ncbi:MBOAT family O-acyltransferase [Marinilabilia salmonicolor]|uniref:MBOAT family O-acyltransferase n=1 Tax=Marinilabilia salmonicolor TaxID=989 RepID=UPI0019019AE0|nr:MBOAT family protein [Marinilabilia salmonicolor]
MLIVVASYVFYSWWDWRFLSLIVFSTIVDYTVGFKLKNEENQSKRKLLLWASIVVNLGFLGVFKYYNFFLDSLYHVIPGLQVVLGFNSIEIILPVGISFYTFQTLSYTIDVYKRKLEPTSDFIAFAAFVSFFPQLVAGPIERATNLLPQFFHKRTFNYAKFVDGMRQILWGLFKKIVVADNCAEFANQIFNNSAEMNGSTLIFGALFFAFQIYGDFSGYSDIAIGTSRLFGFNLMQNFAFPYFSRDIAEFWRRWHISLSTWFRDYLYIPIGGSRGGTLMKVRNTFIIFIVSGFWHGANWTFIIWGALNAIFFLPLLLTNNNRNNLRIVAQDRYLPTFKESFHMLITFALTVFAWVFFRAENLGHAFDYIKGILTSENFFNVIPTSWGGRLLSDFAFSLLNIVLLIVVEWFGRDKQYGIEFLFGIKYRIVRWSLYILLILYIIVFAGGSQDFIYFQF